MKSFEDHLADAPKIKRMDSVQSRFEWKRDISAYYYNKSMDLRAAALLLGHSLSESTKVQPCEIGLPEGFSFDAALPNVFGMLSGLSVELLLKAIFKILSKTPPKDHRLGVLAAGVGVPLSDNQAATLAAMTEMVIWSGRYPVPKELKFYDAALEIQDALMRPSKIGGSRIMQLVEERAVNVQNYNLIWAHIESFYARAREVIREP